ncbi:MAG: 50S ribosomal protein L10 [Clostridiaceae bacterium]|nr:50S ribosomal protein L10 [Clostridiaceae bacterium]
MPSKKILEQKKQAVQELAEKMSRASSGVLVDYRGLTVEQDTVLRNRLRKAGVEYKVVKNTLTRLAAKQTGLDELDPFLHGPTSLALTYDDPVAAAKVLSEYAKENDKLEIKVGFIEGRIIDAKEVKALGELPPKEVLIARVLGGFNAPIAGFVNVLSANIRGLAVALKAIADKRAQAGEA